ncbi:type III secretion system chaperone [Pleionea sediminis]|uniref:type III secretion system chaperone n=1 Tax=Pleionea sediminis TaxID=2569479 RepID=UPI001185FCC8|nr:type III secretion system chaperone [Pleionea sediminis]
MLEEQFTTLIQGYGKSVGINNLLIHDGYKIFLTFKPNIKIDFQWRSKTEDILVFSNLLRISNYNQDFLVELLNANYFWSKSNGATLSIDSATDCIFLTDRWTLQALESIESLTAAINRFVATAKHWKSIAQDNEYSESRANHDNSSFYLQNNFIRG